MKTKIVKVDEVKIQSLIKKNFSNEFMKKIYDIYSNDYISIVEKTIMFDDLFTKEFGGRKDYRRIGEGTNRFVCLLDNHIIKVAYNYLAYIDNMNELAQSKYKNKYLAQAFETNGIILVSEYVTVMDKMEFLESQYHIKKILDTLSIEFSEIDEKKKFYILGDMGMSHKNYGNWGRRMNGEIVVLDYGYLYELSNAEWKEVAKCPVCGSSLEYTPDYSELVCTREDCKSKVKYTTLRNTFGYANIIDNIVDNLNDDRYIKFDKNGEVMVDVLERIEIEEEKKEEFVMPEDIMVKINKAKEQFFLISEKIKYSCIDIDEYYDLKEEIINERDEYDEMLFPFVLASIDMNPNNINKYIKDFEKFSTARYNKLYKELKGEFDKENEEIEEDLPDCYDEQGEYTVRGYESELKLIDRMSDNGEDKVIKTSLDDMFSSEFKNDWNNLFNAEDPMLNSIEDDNEFTLDHIMGLLNINEKLVAEDKLEKQREEEEQEKLDKDYQKYMAEKELQEAYNELEESLLTVIKSKYRDADCLYSEDEYVTGDVYRTYLNGDYIDLDYSPKVNAKNILGGWEPNKFAFPLYRHLLIKFDYDMDQIENEFQAIYRVDEEVEAPEDLYDNITNRNLVIGQIMHRFEDSMKPARHTLIMNIGGELNNYYKALDNYYEVVKPTGSNVDINDPDYYLKVAEDSEQLTKLMREAKMELKDELINDGYRLEDLLDDNKIVYYYDLESIMTNTELNILDIIQNADLSNVVNVKEYILNEYYIQYNSILPDSVFDIFKYNGSIEKEEGCVSHPRIIKPRIKAKLVSKNKNIDTFKPEVFNRNKYKVLTIEQRYDMLVNMDDPEEITAMNDVKLKMKNKNLVYTERPISKYVVKKSKDNMRYGLTENEIKLIEEYENMLGLVVINDVDKLVKRTVVELLNQKYNMCEETKEFMYNLANSDLSEAYANRLLKIHVLELNGITTRLDYLTHVE
jgi:hypothetical protein